MENLASQTRVVPAVDDCWNRIGVRGDRSCAELVQHVHCRNCPVFAAAARALLDRPLPAGYRETWTRHFAEPEATDDRDKKSAVIFRLGSEWFALPTEIFNEITELRRIHALPHPRNAFLLGLVNVRGELIICVSLARMLGLDGSTPPPAEPARRALGRLVVIGHVTGPIAFPVDEVQPSHRFRAAGLKGVPGTIAKAGSNYTKGILAWRDRPVGYLDAERIVQAIDRGLA